jgi:hypothetical protein
VKKDDPDYLQFDIFLGLYNVTSSSLTHSAKQSLVETIHEISDIGLSEISYTGITDIVESFINVRRRLTRRRLALVSEWAMVTELHVNLSLADFPQFHGNATKLSVYLKSVLTSSVEDKLFETLLRQTAVQSAATEFNIAEVRQIEFKNFQLVHPLHSPTSLPSSIPSFTPTEYTAADTLTFHAYWAIYNISGSVLSLNDKMALLTALADLMDISITQVSFIAITDQLDAPSTHAMVIKTKIQVPLADFDSLDQNRTKVYNYLTKLLSESIWADTSFTSVVRREAHVANGFEFFGANVTEVQFQDFELLKTINPPTTAPTFPSQSNMVPTSRPTSGSLIATTAIPIVVLTEAPNEASTTTIPPSVSSTTVSSDVPTAVPSAMPSMTIEPTDEPTAVPSATLTATEELSDGPTEVPTEMPSMTLAPSYVPTAVPSATLTAATEELSDGPTEVPTAMPSMTLAPTFEPTAVPSAKSPTTVELSEEPTAIPVVSVNPSEALTTSAAPSGSSNIFPSEELTVVPSAIPTNPVEPSEAAVAVSSSLPTAAPTTIAPIAFPNTLSLMPTAFPSVTPSAERTTGPSIVVSILHTTFPSFSPSPASSSFSMTPTGAPTSGIGAITYKVILEFADVADASVSPTDELVLSGAVAAIVGTADENVKFLTLRTVVPARRRRLAAYSVTVALLVGLDAVDFPQFQGNVSKIYENTTGNCLEAFKNGHLTSKFHQVARHFHSGTFESATVISIAFEDAEFVKPGNTNTNSASVSETPLNKKTLAAVIACCTLIGSAICLFMICFAWKTNSRKTAPLPTTENIEEMDKIPVFPAKIRGRSFAII